MISRFRNPREEVFEGDSKIFKEYLRRTGQLQYSVVEDCVEKLVNFIKCRCKGFKGPKRREGLATIAKNVLIVSAPAIGL